MKSEKRADHYSAKFLRKRKFLVVLPVLVLPFVTLLLWTLGFVGGTRGQKQKINKTTGVNLRLPDAAPAKDSAWSKIKYYEQADKEAAKKSAYLKADPYRSLETGEESRVPTLDAFKDTSDQKELSQIIGSQLEQYRRDEKTDYNEEKVYRKLEALNRELKRMDGEDKSLNERMRSPKSPTESINPDIARLEAMMQSLQAEPTESKELSRLDQMLDKIVRIQNPPTILEADSAQETSTKNKRQVFTVQAPSEDIISVLEPQNTVGLSDDSLPEKSQEMLEFNRFYSLEDTAPSATTNQAISAVIHQDQTLVSGGTVKLSVLDPMYIGGVCIPKDQFVHGVATLNGERLSIKISSIVYNRYLLPVSLTVYDADGIAGIHVPGAITREVAKRSAAQSVQGLGALNTLDPSLGAQVTTAGLQAAQNLLGRSAKLVRVHLKAGYRVLLKDESKKEK